ncbi:MAG: 3-deoxy-manno-octulosonate cytidylyltransferase [Epsilonproteobacteria bacterium]|nr:3-deoxy-manno-octulosonate cytidylyltransferase [Campylobacterota bacterium]
MFKNKKIVCVIPARLASTRFPRKVLTTLHDKPLLQWVWEAAKKVVAFDRVLFAIDSQETARLLDSFGADYVMTDSACPSGTHRVIEVARRGDVHADVWVNWQGDEPFITSTMIDDLLQSCDQTGQQMWTLCKTIENEAEIFASNIAKIVCDKWGKALYFSRSPIPHVRDQHELQSFFQQGAFKKHIGIYAYTTQTLEKIASLESNMLEDAEKLEQLRFLANGIAITVHNTSHEVMGIDTEQDLARATLRCQSLA